MSTETTMELPLEAARALVAHLRQNPEDAELPPTVLANRFGLSERLVETVLENVEPLQRAEEHPHLPHVSFGWIPRLWKDTVAAFDRSIARPTVFVGATLGVALVVAAVASFVTNRLGIETFGVDEGRLPYAILVPFLFVVVLHDLCYFRRAMTRYAAYGGLLFWVVTSLPLMVLVWAGTRHSTTEAERAVEPLLVSFGMFVLALVYTGFGALCAVLGGWVRLKREDRAQERMSRQEMLERYFELQRRLKGSAPVQPEKSWEDWPLVVRVRKAPYLWAFGASVVLTLLSAVVSVATPRMDRNGVTFLVLETAVTITSFVVFLAATFLAGGLGRAAITAAAFSLGGTVAQLIPVGRNGPGLLLRANFQIREFTNLVGFLLLALAVGAGAIVQRRAARALSLQRNDQATILGEMLRIQWRLAEEAEPVCVMVVDAAKSAEMKAAADHLAVEYSFREYQDWIGELSDPRGGRIHSTAGDGAVVAFENPAAAFAAARAIQTDLPRFNRDVNRLESPFRLRIGLHMGQVQGDLEEVQFTEVIDIAAHVQGVAPIGGIAATEVVVQGLGEAEFVPLAKQVDGHGVYLALEPVEA